MWNKEKKILNITQEVSENNILFSHEVSGFYVVRILFRSMATTYNYYYDKENQRMDNVLLAVAERVPWFVPLYYFYDG